MTSSDWFFPTVDLTSVFDAFDHIALLNLRNSIPSVEQPSQINRKRKCQPAFCFSPTVEKKLKIKGLPPACPRHPRENVQELPTRSQEGTSVSSERRDARRQINSSSIPISVTRQQPEDAKQLLPRSFEQPLAITIEEGREELIIRADVPGVQSGDIDLQAENGILKLSITRKHAHSEELTDYSFAETLVRRVPLPRGADDIDNIVASLKDGILEIRVPTPEEKPVRKIPVNESPVTTKSS